MPDRDAEMGGLLQERPDFKLIVIDADLVPDTADAVSEARLSGADNWIFVDDFAERLRLSPALRQEATQGNRVVVGSTQQ
jgi:hypothetical protein